MFRHVPNALTAMRLLLAGVFFVLLGYYQYDGRGAPTARTGRGRRLVQAIAAELGGSIDWTFAPGGCCVRLDFPGPDTGLIDLRLRPSERVSHFSQPASGGRFG